MDINVSFIDTDSDSSDTSPHESFINTNSQEFEDLESSQDDFDLNGLPNEYLNNSQEFEDLEIIQNDHDLNESLNASAIDECDVTPDEIVVNGELIKAGDQEIVCSHENHDAKLHELHDKMLEYYTSLGCTGPLAALNGRSCICTALRPHMYC